MTPAALLAKLHAAGITARADGDRIRLDGPRGALNESVLSAVKDSKAELLGLLTEMVGGTSYADREWDRFFARAVPTPNGLGLYDPSESPDMPTGVPGEAWDAFVADCGNLGRGSRAPFAALEFGVAGFDDKLTKPIAPETLQFAFEAGPSRARARPRGASCRKTRRLA